MRGFLGSRTLGNGFVQTLQPPPFSAGPCPAQTKYQKGRGCCITPAQRPKGAPRKAQCCAPGKTRVVAHAGGISLSCKPATGGGGGGGGTGGGGAAGTPFRVTGVSGSTLTADRQLSSDCKSGQQAELRRPGVSGMAEFGGDIDSISGNQVNFSGQVSNPPAVGDTFIIYCANTGGGGADLGGGGGFDMAGLLPSGGMSTYLLIGGIALGAYFLFKNKGGGYAPAPRRYR